MSTKTAKKPAKKAPAKKAVKKTTRNPKNGTTQNPKNGTVKKKKKAPVFKEMELPTFLNRRISKDVHGVGFKRLDEKLYKKGSDGIYYIADTNKKAIKKVQTELEKQR
jgi:hypothetical protein